MAWGRGPKGVPARFPASAALVRIRLTGNSAVGRVRADPGYGWVVPWPGRFPRPFASLRAPLPVASGFQRPLGSFRSPAGVNWWGVLPVHPAMPSMQQQSKPESGA